MPCVALGTHAPKIQEAEYVRALRAELDRYPAVRPELAARVILVESHGQIDIGDGRHGEIGAMQIRPRTFAYVSNEILHRKTGKLNPRRPQDNLAVGVALLNWLLERYDHDETLALIGYNAGIGTADKAKRKIARGQKARIPRSTRAYIAAILRAPQEPVVAPPQTLLAVAYPVTPRMAERGILAAHPQQTWGHGGRSQIHTSSYVASGARPFRPTPIYRFDDHVPSKPEVRAARSRLANTAES